MGCGVDAGATAYDDCEFGVGGSRKACKNCVCGRAEMDTEAAAAAAADDAPKSACGNVRTCWCSG